MDGFINTLRTAKKNDSTLRLYSTITKLFFSYLSKQGKYLDVAADCAPLNLRKSSTHKKKALTDTQAKKFLASVKGDNLIARRDKATIALCLTCGLRTCEVSLANVGDFKKTNAIKADIDVREVAAMLRHTSIIVTAVYLHDLSVESRRAELAVADALFCA